MMTTESEARPCSTNAASRSRRAMRPSFALTSRPSRSRAQCCPKRGAGATPRGERGKPGARCTRSRAWWVESTRVSHHRFTGTPGLPCAMVLTGSSALSLVTGLCCHHHRRDAKHHRQLDASVGASGPHGFAVRAQRHSSFDVACVHRIPHPTFVTIAIRPLVRAGQEEM
jgi:hypothetical protein